MNTSISELLYEYECVVLPDFGGFITNNKPARWNRITHQFDPPYKEVLFNVQLKTNDGLLVKHIAEKQSLSYKTARQEVAAFVNECRTELASGKRLEFTQIGTLFLDESQHIVFEQDFQTNYNPGAFGLSSLVSPAIKRTSQEEKIKEMLLTGTKKKTRPDRKPERDTDEKESGRRKPVYGFPFTIAGLLLLVIVVTSLFFPWPSSMISLRGFFSPSEDVTGTEIRPNQLQTENTKTNEAGFLPDNGPATESIEQEQAAESAVEEETPKTSETTEAENKNGFPASEIPAENITAPTSKTPIPTIDKGTVKIQATSKQYFIIAGSFSKEENARKLVAQLAEKGYSAMVADTSKNGMYRVAYVGFYKWADAKQQLLAIRKEGNTDAWVLKK